VWTPGTVTTGTVVHVVVDLLVLVVALIVTPAIAATGMLPGP